MNTRGVQGKPLLNFLAVIPENPIVTSLGRIVSQTSRYNSRVILKLYGYVN